MTRALVVPEIVTPRLRLRGWRESDRDAFAELNADRAVMEYFVSALTREQSDAALDRYQRMWAEQGYGFWCAELLGTGAFVGIIGLGYATFEASFTPVIEVGWRLSPDQWGKGLASEGARASLKFGFETTDTQRIVAITAATNVRSRRVMERLGMSYRAQLDFQHPAVPVDHPLQPHVVYEIGRAEFTVEGVTPAGRPRH